MLARQMNDVAACDRDGPDAVILLSAFAAQAGAPHGDAAGHQIIRRDQLAALAIEDFEAHDLAATMERAKFLQ